MDEAIHHEQASAAVAQVLLDVLISWLNATLLSIIKLVVCAKA